MQVRDRQVVRHRVPVVVADGGDRGGGAVGLAEVGARGELGGVGPAVGGGVPEGVVPGGGERLRRGGGGGRCGGQAGGRRDGEVGQVLVGRGDGDLLDLRVGGE